MGKTHWENQEREGKLGMDFSTVWKYQWGSQDGFLYSGGSSGGDIRMDFPMMGKILTQPELYDIYRFSPFPPVWGPLGRCHIV